MDASRSPVVCHLSPFSATQHLLRQSFALVGRPALPLVDTMSLIVPQPPTNHKTNMQSVGTNARLVAVAVTGAFVMVTGTRSSCSGRKRSQSLISMDSLRKSTRKRRRPKERVEGERPQFKNAAFDIFYKANLVETGLMDAGMEWESFIDCLNRPLPSTFWITPTAADANKVKSTFLEYQCEAEGVGGTTPDQDGLPLKLHPLSWMPDDMGWRIDIPKRVLRKDKRFNLLHNTLKQYTENGTINRMEEVSMLPVAVLNIGPGQRCLDMCASPGNKTAQMLAELAKANFEK